MIDEASSRHSEFLQTQSGTIIEPSGAKVILFGVNEFNEWWSSFESYYEAPIGRKLIYAASDDEEHHLGTDTSYEIPKWFGKKTVFRRMNTRWITMGWGVNAPLDARIQSPCHDLLGAGFALAHYEHQNGKRYQMEWRQLNSEFIKLDFTEKLDEIPLAPKAVMPAWVLKREHSDVTTTSLEHEIDLRSFGFFKGQERAMFLPVSVFYRLYYSVLGRPFQAGLKWSNTLHIEGLDHSSTSLVEALSESSALMFKSSDYTIFVQTQSDWEAHIKTRISSRGFGTVTVEEFVAGSSPSVRMSLNSPLPGLALGLLISMWERAHGAPCSSEVIFNTESALIYLHPRKVEYI